MSEETQPQPRRGCWHVIKLGCLGLIGLIAVVVVGVLVVNAFFSGPDAREVYSGTPDPVATARLNQELANHGLTGASALVIPIKGQNGQIAIFTLDESQGFQGSGQAGLDAFTRSLLTANSEGGHNISQVAVDYRGPDGENLFTVATDQATLEAYANGQITRQEMLANTDANLSNLLAAFDIYQEGGQ